MPATWEAETGGSQVRLSKNEIKIKGGGKRAGDVAQRSLGSVLSIKKKKSSQPQKPPRRNI